MPFDVMWHWLTLSVSCFLARHVRIFAQSWALVSSHQGNSMETQTSKTMNQSKYILYGNGPSQFFISFYSHRNLASMVFPKRAFVTIIEQSQFCSFYRQTSSSHLCHPLFPVGLRAYYLTAAYLSSLK